MLPAPPCRVAAQLFDTDAILSLLLVTGCRSTRQNRDVVERELRIQENHARELKDELHKQQWLNHAMQQQLAEQHHHQLSSGKIVPADPGTAGNRVQEIALAALLAVTTTTSIPAMNR